MEPHKDPTAPFNLSLQVTSGQCLQDRDLKETFNGPLIKQWRTWYQVIKIVVQQFCSQFRDYSGLVSTQLTFFRL